MVVIFSLLAGQWAAEWSDVELTAAVRAVILAQGLLLAALMLQWRRHNQVLRDQMAVAAFSRDSADVLTRQREPEQVLQEAARLLAGFLGTRVAVMQALADGSVRAWAEHPSRPASGRWQAEPAPSANQPVADAVRWSAINARPVGPGTDNWPTFPFWYVPFSRLPGDQPVLVVEVMRHPPVPDTLSFLRGFVDLLAASHARLQSLQRAHDAELQTERQRLQNRFLASISHDMRTPLTGILGASSTLLEQGDQLNATQQRHLLEGLHRQVRYLTDATDNILSLFRLQQASPHDMVTDWESPEELLGLVLARFPQATADGRLLAQAEPVEGLIKANATLVVQALVNLVDNALRLNASFEPVILQVCGQGNDVAYRVADRGPGFPDGFDIHQALAPVGAGPQRAPSGGVGLGLSIVQAIARVHGGQVQAGNRVGGGAEVCLRFPLTSWEAVQTSSQNLSHTPAQADVI